MRIWTFKMKDLKFPTCKKQGSFFWRKLQINKLHEFELTQVGPDKEKEKNKSN
jgi:hypothetical protein